MGIEVTQYRAAIVVFHIITHRMINFPKLFINFRLQVHCAFAAFAFLTLCCFFKNDRYMTYKLTSLLMCMDVHPNPGPTPSDNSSLDILHLNTRSIRYKIEYLSDLSESYHIPCFSETHLDANVDTSSLAIEGFDTPTRKDRSRNGGGIMVYVSELLKYKRGEDLENNRFETIWMEVNLKSKIC